MLLQAFSRARGRARRMPNIAFRLQRFQLDGKKGGHADVRLQFLANCILSSIISGGKCSRYSCNSKGLQVRRV